MALAGLVGFEDIDGGQLVCSRIVFVFFFIFIFIVVIVVVVICIG